METKKGEFKKKFASLFWYLGFHGNAILNFINMPKASTHYGEYSYNVS
jgi:hypothetical protein